MTAARKLKVVVDDFGFVPEGFLPYASEILNRILALIIEVEGTETRMALLETIRTIAVRLETHIAPYADGIVTILPGLWDASGEEHLMKQGILTLLATLSTSVKEESVRYHPLVLPLIKRAVEPGTEVQLYLMEEALELVRYIIKLAVDRVLTCPVVRCPCSVSSAGIARPSFSDRMRFSVS